MLPRGLAADALPEETARFRFLLPAAQTAAHLRAGPCSCDLVRPRQAESREDERDLRRRYGAMGLSRDLIIRELERHRRGPVAPPAAGWPHLLAEFVAEHARNAGPTLYELTFEPGGAAVGSPVTRSVPEVRSDPAGWLREGQPVLVVR